MMIHMEEISVVFPSKGPKAEAKNDDHKATLVWKPIDEKKRSRREESE